MLVLRQVDAPGETGRMELSLIIELNRGASVPMHRQLYEQMRAAILNGTVRSHTRVPASRQLAQALEISRTTVTQSYDQLISEGYLLTRPGAGTFVCAHIPEALLNADTSLAPAQTTDVPETANADVATFTTASNDRLSNYGLRVQHLPERTHDPENTYSFRYGIPDFERFPIKTWRRLVSRHQLASTHWMGYSPDPMGYAPLREEIARYITQVRAVQCEPEQILITHGTQEALGLITRLLMNPGDAIAIENPGYLSGHAVFSANGATLQPVSVDHQGIQIDGPQGLKSIATEKTRLVYVTPSHQFPTGVLMSLSRRLALLQWAQHHNALIIEDDYDSEFRYSGRPIPALQGLDKAGRVLYVGTFSKILFPGLQVGYVVLPPELVPVFGRAKWLCDRQCAWIDQATLADFIREGELAKHVRRMRPVYSQRRHTLITALRKIDTATSAHLEILGDEAGLHIMTRTRPFRQTQERLIQQAHNRGVSLFSARPQYRKLGDREPVNNSPYPRQPEASASQGANELIFGFGAIKTAAIKTAFETIQDLWHAE
ncbi:MAG: PLP-dependent aminotransferase family protein [Cyanobacteria bacterium J06598_3]